MRILASLFLLLLILLLIAHTYWRHKQGKAATDAKRIMYKELDKKAKEGDLTSMYRFAELFYEENDEDYFQLIFKWTSLLAACKQDPSVFLALGDMLLSGYGTEKDPKRALSCYEQSLSADILLGAKSNLSREAHNYVEEQIIKLRQTLDQPTN